MRRLFGLLAASFMSSVLALSGAAAADTLVGWGVNATASHAIATASETPPLGYQLILAGAEASCATTPSSPITLTVTDTTASTTIFQTYVTVGRAVIFGGGVSLPVDHAASAALADCGSGVTGSVNLWGASR
jgi:hypothetical protein